MAHLNRILTYCLQKSALGATLLLALMAAPTAPSYAAGDAGIPERVLGQADAPVTVQEFVSLTCTHCADFYVNELPELKKRYVDTGKVKFILRDFPLDGIGLKAASLARCMPEDEYYPFIDVLYKNQKQWAFGDAPEKILVQYAKLGGLSEERALACLNDNQMQDLIVAARTDAQNKYDVSATPTFVINNDAANKLVGVAPIDGFAAQFDKLLAAKH